MAKKLIISWDEVLELLEKEYKIKDIKAFYNSGGHDGIGEIYQYPEYIEGDVISEAHE